MHDLLDDNDQILQRSRRFMEYNESLLDEGYDFKINLKHEEEVKGAGSIVDQNSRVTGSKESSKDQNRVVRAGC